MISTEDRALAAKHARVSPSAVADPLSFFNRQIDYLTSLDTANNSTYYEDTLLETIDALERLQTAIRQQSEGGLNNPDAFGDRRIKTLRIDNQLSAERASEKDSREETIWGYNDWLSQLKTLLELDYDAVWAESRGGVAAW